MSATKVNYFQVSTRDVFICVLLPVIVTVVSYFIWDNLRHFIDVYVLMGLTLFGFFVAVLVKHRRANLTSKLEEGALELPLRTKIDLSLFMVMPLAMAVFFIWLFTADNMTMPANYGAQSQSSETSQNYTAKEDDKIKASFKPTSYSNELSNDAIKNQFVIFEPDFDSSVEVRFQFISRAFDQILHASNQLRIHDCSQYKAKKW